MKATELRIGNYVYSITCNGEKVIDKVNHVDQQGVIASGIGWMEQEPIPLTEQWLKDFGFEEIGIVMRMSITHFLELCWFKEDGLKIQTIGSGFTECANCKYVHQLQNLYFDLAGKELIKHG